MAFEVNAKGNAAFAAGKITEAINRFTDAINLTPTNHVLYSNRSAAYASLKQYSEALSDAKKTVDLKPGWSKGYSRIGAAHHGLKQYDEAVLAYKKGLEVDPSNETLKSGLKDAESAKLAEKEREKGNECFKEQKYPDAIRHYTEALRRNPKDAKAYSNRAACYTKLGAMPEGLKDADKCIEIDPKFSKGYSRKGAIQFFMKEFDKALETYQEGLKHDPVNPEFLEGVRSCVQQINRASRGDLTPDELKERQAKAMQDPEIQNILKDAESAKLEPGRTWSGAGSGRPGMGNLFGDAFGSDMWAKLTADPATRTYMQQPDFVIMMKDLQRNPSNLNLYLQNQRVIQALSVLLNVKMSGGPGGDEDDVEMPDSVSSSPPKERKRPADEAETVKEKKREAEVEPEPMRRRRKRKERELEERKPNAQKEKEKGNAAYKNKDFETAIVCYTKAVETAIECYTKAVELDDGDILFPTNRAAVYLEIGKATIKVQAELDAAWSSRPLNDGKEADPTTKLGNLNSLSASATTFKQLITQKRILELLESHAFNVNEVDSFSVKTALSVLNRMVDDGLIVKGCQLWCVATDLFEDAGKRELFVSMPDDDGRIAWLTHIAKKN